ncbi:MAG TPA: antitoxin Xre/MbcA/ParS toxin-binding domain-containing protein [Aliidongia sp.]|uniref:type II RES/Xre toxin-antitoxin system antitoxin n=1 Tax=Aliidongia sp. TaxID=1914230 RepID=UPI002DDDA348|nr:antitoxin Xre/MbcA/ParS toxin-binding domain-containing protein [Aliidongia sp.]HEV2676573.1 antitoxin Xre/MbcA/ParS toxin-binding domain-containing protein [Aliidongia sp.]
MALPKLREMPTAEALEIQQVVGLLGGSRALRQSPTSTMDAHRMLLGGLPQAALRHLLGKLVVLAKTESIEKAVGMSLRTFQRLKDSPEKHLSVEQSGRTWKFAGILAKATAVLGSQQEAEMWLEQPAVGLNQERPIDLLQTPAGAELVETFLRRLEYGVYA